MAHGPWNPDLIPFHEVGDGDFHCLSAAAGELSPVLYVSHESPGPASARPIEASFEDWLRRLEFHMGGDRDGAAEDQVTRWPDDDAARTLLSQAFLAAAARVERGSR